MDDLAAAAIRRLARAIKQERPDVESFAPEYVYSSVLSTLIGATVALGQHVTVPELMADAFDYAYAESVQGRPHPVNSATGKFMDRLGSATPAFAHLFFACAIGLAGIEPRPIAEQTFHNAYNTVLETMGVT